MFAVVYCSRITFVSCYWIQYQFNVVIAKTQYEKYIKKCQKNQSGKFSDINSGVVYYLLILYDFLKNYKKTLIIIYFFFVWLSCLLHPGIYLKKKLSTIILRQFIIIYPLLRKKIKYVLMIVDLSAKSTSNLTAFVCRG